MQLRALRHDSRRSEPPRILLALLLVLTLTSALHGQQQTEVVSEEVEVNVVSVYLTATSSKGDFVTNLSPGELTLFEDDVPQTITHFSLITESAEEPIHVFLLIDTSVSMNEVYKQVSKLEMAKEASRMLLQQLQKDDTITLLTFSETPQKVVDRTSDKALIEEKLQALKTDYGRTALLDAVSQISEATKKDPGRKVVFICSDGEDNASQKEAAPVLEQLKENPGLTVITLGTTSFESGTGGSGDLTEVERGKAILKSLADSTAGYAFFPENSKDLDRAMEKLRRVIPSQYDLAYSPVNWKLDGSWRKIRIVCKRRGVQLQYRPGYFAR